MNYLSVVVICGKRDKKYGASAVRGSDSDLSTEFFNRFLYDVETQPIAFGPLVTSEIHIKYAILILRIDALPIVFHLEVDMIFILKGSDFNKWIFEATK